MSRSRALHVLGQFHQFVHRDRLLVAREVVILRQEEHACSTRSAKSVNERAFVARFETRAVRSPSRRIARTRTVTLLPLAHRHARTVPEPLRDFRLLIVVVPARAQRRPERVLVFRQTLNHDRRHALIHAKVRPAPARVLFRKLSHHLQVLLRGCSRLNARVPSSVAARPARVPRALARSSSRRRAALARRPRARRGGDRRARERSIVRRDRSRASRAPARRRVVARDVVARDLSTTRAAASIASSRAHLRSRASPWRRVVARARVGAVVTRVGAVVRASVVANIVVVAEVRTRDATERTNEPSRPTRSIDRSVDRSVSKSNPTASMEFRTTRDGGYGRRARERGAARESGIGDGRARARCGVRSRAVTRRDRRRCRY